MKRIGVFLSSKADLPEVYRAAARDVGSWIGRTGRTLVYGGSRLGLMEELASAVKQSGGRVIGVVPQAIIDRNLVSDLCDTTFYTADLHDRKATLMRESDILVALPGGVGTLDEIFATLAARTLEHLPKRVVLYNAGGFWNGLIALLDDLCRQGLVSGSRESVLTVVENVDELARLCGDE
ncbi:MAG: TIGR00730 family Rossman fold protein [Bacteroidales bacterium]|nr:TIGR00730 family Rossman fold protein [Bacteroidales bacterium]